MNQEVWWKSLDTLGLEHLRVSRTEKEIAAESVILRVGEDAPFQLTYQIICDDKWRVRKVTIGVQSKINRRVEFNSDGGGNWTDEAGQRLPEFTGCFDIDISATPFTNTLPLKRTQIETGESVDVAVVYFLIPEMTVQRSLQRYIRLAENLFRFEEHGIYQGFSAELPVDANGLVIDYPQLFQRIKN